MVEGTLRNWEFNEQRYAAWPGRGMHACTMVGFGYNEAARNGYSWRKDVMANGLVTLKLTRDVMRRAKGLSQRTGRPLDEVLAQTIEVALSPLGGEPHNNQALSTASDARILKLADVSMPGDRRLSRLLDRQQAGSLSSTEQGELLALMEVYQSLLLRKAEALAEAVRRGLRPALEP